MAKRDDTSSTEQTAPSKSQRRREALELKSLAATLIRLPPARLERIPLDPPLRAAIEDARGIRSNVARKRQLQFVAKLLRGSDPGPVYQGIADIEGEARNANARHHRCEAWRDRLIEQGDSALGQLVQRRGGSDRQAIRQLLRNAQRESAAGKPPASARALFRLLREMDEREPLPPLLD
jgi:ribosome-associated protein